MTAAAVIVLAFFAFWGVVSAVTQVRSPWAQRLRRLDPVGILPGWNFFAPRPITSDLEVRYRSWSAAEGVGQWLDLGLPRRRQATDILFNPTRREKKTMFEACARVIKSYSLNHPNDDAVIISMSYLLILGRVSASASGLDADGVQFGIWEVPSSLQRPTTERQVFQSAVHALDEAPNHSPQRVPVG
jgi:hypothetical protein